MQSLPATGSFVEIRHQRWRVDRAFRHGDVIEIDAGGTTFFAPFDRIATVTPRLRPRRVRRQRWHARVAHAMATAESYELPLAARTADIELFSHQLEPWLAFAFGARRLLIADDVGLGKTVEAGLIAAEAIRRSVARRILILAPAALAGQWARELHDRFALAAQVVDAESLRHLARSLPRDVNPWAIDGVFLTSIDFVKQPHVLGAMPALHWDVVIIDEAHGLCGDSERHDAAHALASHARHVVLLTATPHSGDEAAARRLERLGALNVDDGDPMVVFRRLRLDVGPAPLRRVRRLRVRLTAIETRTLDLVGRFSRAARNAASSDTHETTELLLAILGKRALSTFGALVLTIDRRLAFLAGEEIASDGDQLSLSFGDGDDPALSVRIGLPVERERNWLRRLRTVAAAASRVETKLARLHSLIARTNEPAIVFTEFRDSLEIAARQLSRRAPNGSIGSGGSSGSIGVAHGGLSTAQLDEAISDFQAGRTRVLVATDVASQGLNLQQRCRWVIHLDRPWNPVRLEQRAGRVDRLGQVRDVHVTELQVSHDREFELAERVGRRAQAAATSEWLRPCDRWARRGQAAARVLHARRRLAAHWRGPEGIGRPVCVIRTASAALDAVRVYSTDIRDRDGRLREQVVSRSVNDLPEDASADVSAAAFATADSVAKAAAAARADARVRRLARLEGERAARRLSAARALRARRRALTQLRLPGTPPVAIGANDRTRSYSEITESSENEPILIASEPRLVAFEIDQRR